MKYASLKKAPTALKEKINARFGVKPLSLSQADIQSWFDSAVGQRLLKAEKERLDRIMPGMYGYHLMQLSAVDNTLALSRQSPVTHHFSLGVNTQSHSPAVAEFENLPIDAESIDVALLHHALEYSTNPHQLLREAARTVIPNGYIIIVAFNPWSFFSGRKQCGRLLSSQAHRRFHNLRRSRLLDWLRLLDFEPALFEYVHHGLPVQNVYGKKLESLWHKAFPVLGSFYIIVARKSIQSMQIIKPEWKKVSVIPVWAKGRTVQQSSLKPSQYFAENTKKD